MSEVLAKLPEVPNEGKVTPGLAELFNDGRTARSISRAFPEIDQLLAQLQRDAVTEENRGDCGHTLYAMKLIREQFHAFDLRGRADIQAENVKKP